MKQIIQDLSYAELEALTLSLGEKKFRAKQLYEGLTQGKNIREITSISGAFKDALCQRFEEVTVRVKETFYAADGTEKYLFEFADGNLVEGVLMKYKYGYTQCVSTQVGCRMGCQFCASTLGGLIRNLTAGEILSQILLINALHKADAVGQGKEKRAVTNVVLMGSGEPLDNYDEVVKFLRNLTAEGGIAISARNVSLSTCGIVPKMYRLADEGIPLNLTVSLHATDDESRARTMPIAKAYKIADIIKACRHYFSVTGRRFYFEYTLIDGENCDEEHARALIALLKGLPCHVNLIRLNEVKERALKSVSDKAAYRFLGLLEKGGLSATLRRQIGVEIGGGVRAVARYVLKIENLRRAAVLPFSHVLSVRSFTGGVRLLVNTMRLIQGEFFMIGSFLRLKREENNLTQNELAKRTGIKQQNISRWERNEISPSIEFCIILADFYGISIDELVGHEIKKNY